jgi:hypothetical protein
MGRGVSEGISANVMHHISLMMIAGNQNMIGMTDLLCQTTPALRLKFQALTAA